MSAGTPVGSDHLNRRIAFILGARANNDVTISPFRVHFFSQWNMLGLER